MFSINYHIVLITNKKREVFEGEVSSYLEQVIRDVARSRELSVYDIDVRPDHVRMTIAAGPMESPYSIVKAFKNLTWSFLMMKYPSLRETLTGGLWSPSYYIVTVQDVDSKTIDDFVNAHDDVRTSILAF